MKASYYILPSYMLIQVFHCGVMLFFKLSNEDLVSAILNVVMGHIRPVGLRFPILALLQ